MSTGPYGHQCQNKKLFRNQRRLFCRFLFTYCTRFRCIIFIFFVDWKSTTCFVCKGKLMRVEEMERNIASKCEGGEIVRLGVNH